MIDPVTTRLTRALCGLVAMRARPVTSPDDRRALTDVIASVSFGLGWHLGLRELNLLAFLEEVAALDTAEDLELAVRIRSRALVDAPRHLTGSGAPAV